MVGYHGSSIRFPVTPERLRSPHNALYTVGTFSPMERKWGDRVKSRHIHERTWDRTAALKLRIYGTSNELFSLFFPQFLPL